MCEKDVLEAAIKKHAAFNRRFDSTKTYKLVFKDGSEVRTVPGSNPEERFTLRGYKEVSGFSYSKITLYLISAVANFRAHIRDLKECIEEDPDEVDSRSSTFDEDEFPEFPEVNNSPVVHIDVTKTHNTDNQPLTTMLNNQPLQQGSGPGESNQFLVECPICFQKFPIGTVAEHASECGTGFEIIADCEINNEVDGFDNNNAIKETSGNEDTVNGPSESLLKVAIQAIAQKHLGSEEPVRITVRRLKVWEDFQRARTRYYSPEQKLKITFSGEPAVDEGGPKREFFTGKITESDFVILVLLCCTIALIVKNCTKLYYIIHYSNVNIFPPLTVFTSSNIDTI